MKVSALTAYVDKKNRWNAIFKGPQLSLQSFEDRVNIAQSLDSDLSPENLSCDGELPRAEVARRYKELTAAANELARLDPVAAKSIYEIYTGE